MRAFRIVLVLIVFAAAFGAAPRPASADAVGDLRAELQLRLDDDFAGALDRAHKKQLAAVKAAIKALDRPAADLGATAKNLLAAIKPLPKAFPAEFPKASANLLTLVGAAYASLVQEVEDLFNQLSTGVGLMQNAKLKKAADKLKTAAGKQLGLVDDAPTPLKGLPHLAAAFAAIKKGLAVVAKEPKHDVVSATLGATAFAAQNVHVEYSTSANILDVGGNASNAGQFMSVQITSSNLDPIGAQGSFTVSGHVTIGSDPVTITGDYYTSNATLEITSFDPTAQTLKATFHFTATSGANQLVVTDGVIDVANITLVP
jgi:hypothetical protein